MLRLEGWTPNGVFHGADAKCAFDPERGRQPTPKPLTRDEARRIAANIAKLQSILAL
jgi:hypothetical protein